MTAWGRPPARVLAFGGLALLVGGIALLATLRTADWSLTALPRVDADTRLGAAAKALDPSFHTVHPGAYDGQFYWAVAIDPLATGRLHGELDKPSYRYGHPLYGWLAWLLSADSAAAVPAALAAIGLLSLVAASALAATLRPGGSGAEALAVALSPGLVSAVTLDLAEPLAALLLLGALAALARGRERGAWLCVALLPLAKEQLALVALALAAAELRGGSRRRAARVLAALLPAALWWCYARLRLGAWFSSGDSALGAPLSGWRSALLGSGLGRGEGGLRHGAAVAALAVLAALLLLGALRALRRRGSVDLVFLALLAVALCLAPNATAEFTTALRNTAFLVVLLPFVWAPLAARPTALAGETAPAAAAGFRLLGRRSTAPSRRPPPLAP